MTGPLRSREMRGSQRLQDAASDGRPLSHGSAGEPVRILQTLLDRFGYRMPNSRRNGRFDADYGDETCAAVLAFQRNHGLIEDGRAGPQVLLQLDRMALGGSGTTSPAGGFAKQGGITKPPEQTSRSTSPTPGRRRDGPLRSPQMRGDDVLQAAASGEGPPLSRQWKGDSVRILQRALVRLGYPLPNSVVGGVPDGDYQSETYQAVLEFQERNGLGRDGMAGPEVLLRIDALLVQRSRFTQLPRDLLRPEPMRRDGTQQHVAQFQPPDPRVRTDAGDRAARQSGGGGLIPELAPIPMNPVIAGVYASAGEHLGRLFSATRNTLSEVGCGASPSRARFEARLQAVFGQIVSGEGRTQALEDARGADPRRAMIREVVRSLGGSERQADEVAERQLTGYAGRRTPGMQLSGAPTNRQVMDSLYASGRRLYERLGELRRELRQPYRGRDDNYQPGLDQTMEVLVRFPDVAADIYAAADLPGIAGVPPEIVGQTNERANEFVGVAQRWSARRRDRDQTRMVGMVVLGLALGAISFGTLSALTATLVTGGFAIATGAENVMQRAGDYRHTRDAYAAGAASAQTLERSAAQLRGAKLGLVIDLVSMGAASRATSLPRLYMIGAGGTALSTAADPNVMNSPNAVGIIMFAVALGAVSDAGADAAGARLFARAASGERFQLSVAPSQYTVRTGTQVKVVSAVDDAATPVDARLIETNVANNTVVVRFSDGSRRTMRIERVGRLETGSGSSASVVAPGTRLSRQQIEEFGLDAELAGSIERYAGEHGITVYLRGGTPAAMRHRRNGAHPKPLSMKAKSINEIDVQLGIGRTEDIGLVGYGQPLIRPGTTGWNVLTPAQKARAQDRIEEFRSLRSQMERLSSTGGWLRTGPNDRRRYRARVDEHGVVRDATGVPFAGDIDLFTITRADGTPLDRGERITHSRALQGLSGAEIQHHAFTPDWEPDDHVGRQIKERILASFGPDGSKNLLVIDGDGPRAGRWTGE